MVEEKRPSLVAVAMVTLPVASFLVSPGLGQARLVAGGHQTNAHDTITYIALDLYQYVLESVGLTSTPVNH